VAYLIRKYSFSHCFGMTYLYCFTDHLSMLLDVFRQGNGAIYISVISKSAFLVMQITYQLFLILWVPPKIYLNFQNL